MRDGTELYRHHVITAKVGQYHSTENARCFPPVWKSNISIHQVIQRFSFECRKTKTMIGFGLASDWLSRWRKFLNQSQNVVKQNQFRITFDTQLKIAITKGIITGLNLHRFLLFYLSLYSLVFVSNWDNISNTRDSVSSDFSVFGNRMKHSLYRVWYVAKHCAILDPRPSLLFSLGHAQKRRALGSRLNISPKAVFVNGNPKSNDFRKICYLVHSRFDAWQMILLFKFWGMYVQIFHWQ